MGERTWGLSCSSYLCSGGGGGEGKKGKGYGSRADEMGQREGGKVLARYIHARRVSVKRGSDKGIDIIGIVFLSVSVNCGDGFSCLVGTFFFSNLLSAYESLRFGGFP